MLSDERYAASSTRYCTLRKYEAYLCLGFVKDGVTIRFQGLLRLDKIILGDIPGVVYSTWFVLDISVEQHIDASCFDENYGLHGYTIAKLFFDDRVLGFRRLFLL